MSDNSTKSPADLVDEMPEAFVSNARISNEVGRRVAAGRLRKIASRLYTRNLKDNPEAIVLRNLWSIVAGYFPGALVADRTAIELKPATDGSVCLVTRRGSDIELPGVVLRPRRGAPPQEDDRPFMGQNLFLSSQARACLDNLLPSRSRNGRTPRTLPRSEIEDYLERQISIGGVSALKKLRDEGKPIAEALGRNAQQVELERIAGALTGSGDAKLTGASAIARAKREPYDAKRVALFESLFAWLRQTPTPDIPAVNLSRKGADTLAFFESYFSNYIEGTRFRIKEAEDIVFRGQIPQRRSADACDVLGVWRIVSDLSEMRRIPANADKLLDILRKRHAAAFRGRDRITPGHFKTVPNQVGSYVFVAPDAVCGTLKRGFEIGRGLTSAFHRAAFMHFLIAETHAFADGNGRIARIMMNAELASANEGRIVIPTVYRENYIAGIKALSSGNSAEPYVRMLQFAHRWTASVPWKDIDSTTELLKACNAFDSEAEAEAKGANLTFPDTPDAQSPLPDCGL